MWNVKTNIFSTSDMLVNEWDSEHGYELTCAKETEIWKFRWKSKPKQKWTSVSKTWKRRRECSKTTQTDSWIWEKIFHRIVVILYMIMCMREGMRMSERWKILFPDCICLRIYKKRTCLNGPPVNILLCKLEDIVWQI